LILKFSSELQEVARRSKASSGGFTAAKVNKLITVIEKQGTTLEKLVSLMTTLVNHTVNQVMLPSMTIIL
jgi:hypothetical protein